MNLQDVKEFKATITPQKEIKKTFIDFAKGVKDETICPILDDRDNIIGINFISGATGTKVMKVFGADVTVGNTEEERQRDEDLMRENKIAYANCPINSWFEIAYKFIKSDVEINKAAINTRDNHVLAIISNDKVYAATTGIVIFDFSDKKESELIDELIKTKIQLYFNRVLPNDIVIE